jgi:hypothetical protein
MDMAVEKMSVLDEAKNTVEIVMHISENLEERQRSNLVTVLESNDEIVSAEFCPLHYHLMLVRYDKDQHSSKDVLSAVTGQNLQARLIGPI